MPDIQSVSQFLLALGGILLLGLLTDTLGRRTHLPRVTLLLIFGIIGLVYIICRATGKYLGAMLGSHFCQAGKATKRWMGIALLPQAGVAIGIALVAAEHDGKSVKCLDAEKGIPTPGRNCLNAYSGSLGGGGACSLPLDGFTTMVLG